MFFYKEYSNSVEETSKKLVILSYIHFLYCYFIFILDLTPYENGTKDTGILAQEVEALGLPGLTTTRGDGVKAVRYDRLIPVLIEAIKELKSKVEDLQK